MKASEIASLIVLGGLIVAAVAHSYRHGYRNGCRATEAKWQHLMQVIDWADSPRKANL